MSTSKTGKHGHAKCNFTAIDIFTGKKYEDIIPSTHTAHVPFVVRKEYSLVDISADDFCSLMDDEGNCREDVKLPDYPDNYAREIKTAFESYNYCRYLGCPNTNNQVFLYTTPNNYTKCDLVNNIS